MITHIKGLDVSQRWSKKKLKMADLENSKWPLQKNLLMKFSWIGPWVSRIDWCEGHWFVSTYMAVRLSDVSSKTDKKCVFCVFRLFLSLCRTASRPYKLSHTNALCINQPNQLTQEPIHKNFMKKYWELAELENEVFLRRPFWIF